RLALEGFAHPHDGREIAWDVRHLGRLAPLAAGVEDPLRRSQVEEGIERFRAIEGELALCRAQVLHNDFSRSNIVADRATAGFVTGVIDFGDVVRTHVVVDVSTAVLNQLKPVGTDDMFDRARDLLAGYLAVADLDPTELRLLPHLVMARIIARALITTWRAAQFPANAPYIMRNTAQGWSQLGYFLKRSPEEVEATFAGSVRKQRAEVPS
ncbi:MAG TPA: phosphotransferase, partial [Amaricoccus sp.]|nr:phosphotransferase [Amaricoccus sp.]